MLESSEMSSATTLYQIKLSEHSQPEETKNSPENLLLL